MKNTGQKILAALTSGKLSSEDADLLARTLVTQRAIEDIRIELHRLDEELENR